MFGARRGCIELPHRWYAACFLWSGVHWNAVHEMKFILITIIWRFDCFKIWWTYLCMCESNETTHHIMNMFFYHHQRSQHRNIAKAYSSSGIKNSSSSGTAFSKRCNLKSLNVWPNKKVLNDEEDFLSLLLYFFVFAVLIKTLNLKKTRKHFRIDEQKGVYIL